MLIDSAAQLLRLLPAELAHRTTVALVGAAPYLGAARGDDPRLAISVLGLDFPNPVGLAAGFDKNAEVPDQMAKLGFGFVECGTVTPRPQRGNPKPRLFRLAEDRAVINRMGFNNYGMARAAERLRRRKGRGIVGINIGANKDSADRGEDYRVAFATLAPLADYVTVNVSSPNTPGLRDLQSRDELARLLASLTAARTTITKRVPILLKIAPDVDAQALDDIVDVVLASGIEGMIVCNTTTARPPTLASRYARETGGLSGAPLFSRATYLLREVRRRVGTRLVLIGVGGIASSADAYAKIRAGASLVQLYSALVYEGPGLVYRIKSELAAMLARDGFERLCDAIGADITSA